MTRRRFGWFLVCLFGFVGCTKRPWSAPISELEHGLEVVVKKAYVQNDETLEVETTVVNKSDQAIRIDRKYWALELPAGQTLRHEDTSNIAIPPGGASDVNVSFDLPNDGFKTVASATLIVGGVFIEDDPSPYPAGEIPLTQGTVPSASASVSGAPAPSGTASGEASPRDPAPPTPKPETGPTMLKPEADE